MYIQAIVQTVKVIWKALTHDYYLSTRISANKGMAWTVAGNLKEARARALAVQGKVINPGDTAEVIGSRWTDVQYMRLWRITLRIMAIRGRSLISYAEDVPISRGCTEERALAYRLGMSVIIKKGGDTV